MGYIDKKLTVNESLIYRAKIHWLVFLKPILGLIAIVCVIATTEKYLIDLAPAGILKYKSATYAGLFFLVVLPSLTQAILKRMTTEIAITDQRILNKKGFISVELQGMPLSKIENIDSKQTVLGRLFGYGNVIVKGSGSTPIELVNISKPLTFRNELAAQIDV